MIIWIQIALFATVVILTFLIGGYFQIQTRHDKEISENIRLQDEVRKLGDRLDGDAVLVREMMYTVTNKKNLWSSDRDKQYFAKNEIQKNMSDKRVIYEDMELLFVARKDDFFLRVKNPSVIGGASINYCDYMVEHMEEMGSISQGRQWLIRNINGNNYCFLIGCYIAEDIYVGVGIQCSDLFEDIRLPFLESGGSVRISDIQGNYDLSGNGQMKSMSTIHVEGTSQETGLSVEGDMRDNSMEYIYNTTTAGILLLGILCIVSVTVQNMFLRKVIVAPVTELADKVKNITVDDNKMFEITLKSGCVTQEIDILKNALNYLLKEVIAAKLQLYEKKMREQERELRMLRAQLRPHFYLNSIMTVNSMTYQNRNEDIREYLACFSDYMRYMMKIHTDMIPLKQELTHIRNYVDMQEIKFPSSVLAVIDCPKELENVAVPHLLLYTVIENSFKYAMNLQDTLLLFITCETFQNDNFDGYRVTVEDNGPGFTEEKLFMYNREQIVEERKEESHIGLSNVKRSLFLQYQRSDLLKLTNVSPHGAKIEIYIPKEKKNGIESNNC